MNEDYLVCTNIESEQRDLSDLTFTPSDLEKGIYLKPMYYVLNNGLVFCDKLLPDPKYSLLPDKYIFTTNYYVKLHFDVSLFQKYNHLGARIPL